MDIIFVLVFIASIITFIILGIGKKNNKSENYTPITTLDYQTPIDYKVKEIKMEDKIKANNPDFSEDNFKRFAEMVYITYHSAITTFDTSVVKDFLHKDMYSTLDSYINGLKIANRHIINENIIVDSITFLNYEKENNVENLKILLNVHSNNYEVDSNGMVISGYKTRIVSKEDVLEFQRNHNDLYKGEAIVCPNCLASLQNVSEKCSYCGAAIKYNDKTNEGWKLCNITKYYNL